jgi:hypothetical protein
LFQISDNLPKEKIKTLDLIFLREDLVAKATMTSTFPPIVSNAIREQNIKENFCSASEIKIILYSVSLEEFEIFISEKNQITNN